MTSSLPLQSMRAVMTFGANGGAFLVVDLPSRRLQQVALGTTAAPAQPTQASAATLGGAPWGFALDATSGSVFGFDLSPVNVSASPDRVLSLAGFAPSRIAAGTSAVLAVSDDVSSNSEVVTWGSDASVTRLSDFSGNTLPRCVAALPKGFFLAAQGDAGAEFLLLGDSGNVTQRQSATALASALTDTTPIACAANATTAAVVFAHQLAIVSLSAGAFGAATITALPAVTGVSPHVAITPTEVAVVAGNVHEVWLVPLAGGSVHTLALDQTGTAVAVATSPDNAALLVAFGTGSENTALDAWFLSDSVEIPISQFTSADTVSDLAVVSL